MKFSEYVSLGHPDKVADYISEYILDRLIEQDKNVRYAVEVQIKDNNVTLGGEVTTTARYIEYKRWTRDAIIEIGYTPAYFEEWGEGNTINPDDLNITIYINSQSADIAQGVNRDAWGDQGIMYGLAVSDKETDYMPKDFYTAKKLGQDLFKSGLGGLDIKTQVVCDSGTITKIIVAIPLKRDTAEVEKFVRESIKGDYELIINGTGRYVTHASQGDCGTTGRKLAVDFYGGNCNVGGGSPWTKDATKADLSLNILARWLAFKHMKKTKSNYIKCGIECCIGRSDLTIVYWDIHNNVVKTEKAKITPSEVINLFNLDKPIYADLCRNGLFSKLDYSYE